MYRIITERIPCPFDAESTETIDITVKRLVPEGCPPDPLVMFSLGNESAISDSKMETIWKAYGSRGDMIILTPEHRGYGSSITAGDQDLPGYVTPEAALADYHTVMEHYRYLSTRPWIVSGFSYGGALSIAYAAKYPDGIGVVHSSSGVVDWPAMMPEYDMAVRENAGEKIYERMCRHIDRLSPAEPFDKNWQNREIIYALATAMTQMMGSRGKLVKVLLGFLSLPTGMCIAMLKAADRVAGSPMVNYMRSNMTPNVSHDEVVSGKYDWRVWRWQQFSKTGTFWAPSGKRSIYRRSEEDWKAECHLLFGTEADVFDNPPWDVRAMLADLKVPLVYVRGGRDPWRRIGIENGTEFPFGGEIVSFDDCYHCPDRDPGTGNGEKVMGIIMKYLDRG